MKKNGKKKSIIFERREKPFKIANCTWDATESLAVKNLYNIQYKVEWRFWIGCCCRHGFLDVLSFCRKPYHIFLPLSNVNTKAWFYRLTTNKYKVCMCFVVSFGLGKAKIRQFICRKGTSYRLFSLSRSFPRSPAFSFTLAVCFSLFTRHKIFSRIYPISLG